MFDYKEILELVKKTRSAAASDNLNLSEEIIDGWTVQFKNLSNYYFKNPDDSKAFLMLSAITHILNKLNIKIDAKGFQL